MIKETGSVRIDLLGGTLDLEPINLILPHALTLNAATSLKAEVTIEETDKDLEIISVDYDSHITYKSTDFNDVNFSGDFFGPLRFVAKICDFLQLTDKLKITLTSGSPAGAGLGGSSTMGVTLYKALLRVKKQKQEACDIIAIVKRIEAEELKCGPTGYQDYYPALYGGILALRPTFAGVEVTQLCDEEIALQMNKRMSLVFSGQTRLSGINNWEVYKGFFDDQGKTKRGLGHIANLSHQAYKCLQNKEMDLFFELIKQEGEARAALFPGIMTKEIENLLHDIRKIDKNAGLKMCGAGGGGCFLVIHESEADISKALQEHKMSKLDFSICKPCLL
jgi:D-glycero-alpha-D-manno-heptose-7-phosphate kinase